VAAQQQHQQLQHQQPQHQQPQRELPTQPSAAAAGSSHARPLACDWCGLPGLSAEAYWRHQPLYHIDAANLAGACQLCGRRVDNIADHLHHAHAPPGRAPEQRTGVFALCVIQRPADGKFLMTQEYAGERVWPAAAVAWWLGRAAAGSRGLRCGAQAVQRRCISAKRLTACVLRPCGGPAVQVRASGCLAAASTRERRWSRRPCASAGRRQVGARSGRLRAGLTGRACSRGCAV
jgi:5-methylcytosine-specific restriction endonuclease McrA